MDLRTWVEQLLRAVNAHDVDDVVACFAPDYTNETPAHPGQGFVGHEQVRTNWTRIFAGVPDVTADLLRTAVQGDELWSEWEMRGTRPDGLPHLMRGVIIFTVVGGLAVAARFFLEQVDPGAGGVDAAVARIVEVGQ